jgi:small subunit ribosomal protein S2
MKEHIAVSEARKLNIPTFAITDTNTDPTLVDFAIPANDDATKSIALIVETMVKAIEEGLSERKQDKELEKEKEAEGDVAVEDGAEPRVLAVTGADDEEPEVLTEEKPKTNLRPRKTTAGAGKPGGARKKMD